MAKQGSNESAGGTGRQVDVVVLGGGAAGLMGAAVAGRRGRRVLVLEHAERVGKKILMSGGGRCNFTNRSVGPANYLSANPHFCKSALARYRPEDFIALVKRYHIAFHEKELGQLFCDGSSRQIVELLLAECREAGVEIEVGTSIAAVEHAALPTPTRRFTLRTSRGVVHTNSLVVATGGLSIPSMGATGFGYDLARQFGLEVLPTRAGLVPFTVPEADRAAYAPLAGISLPVRTRFGKTQFQAGLLFTHRGLSGPAILQISSYWQPGQTIEIDWLPQEDAGESLEAFLLAKKRQRPGAELKTILAERLPKRLAHHLSPADSHNRPLGHHADAELRKLAARLHQDPFFPAGTEGYRKAEVTLGGIATAELSSTTLEAKKVPGLFCIGEVVDVTGQLGGYNFQWAWASGFAAGQVA